MDSKMWCWRCGALSLVLMVMLVTMTSVGVDALDNCAPWSIDTEVPLNYTMLEGTWFVAGRDDIGGVDKRLTNAQVKLTIQDWNSMYNPSTEYWFLDPRGCCMLQMEYFGRNTNGQCTGRTYEWGVSRDVIPGVFKHKLIGISRHSMLYVISTDYTDHLVLGHCDTYVDVATYQFYCTHFNIFLLYRTQPTSATVTNFDTTTVSQRIGRACSGNINFSSTLDAQTACQYPSIAFTTPAVFDINSL